MEVKLNGKRAKSNLRSLRYEVKIVPMDAYPDLKTNPTNPYTQMSDEERMDELIDILGLLWAEACLGAANHNPRAIVRKPEFRLANRVQK